jgi:hypothetical protein
LTTTLSNPFRAVRVCLAPPKTRGAQLRYGTVRCRFRGSRGLASERSAVSPETIGVEFCYHRTRSERPEWPYNVSNRMKSRRLHLEAKKTQKDAKDVLSRSRLGKYSPIEDRKSKINEVKEGRRPMEGRRSTIVNVFRKKT